MNKLSRHRVLKRLLPMLALLVAAVGCSGQSASGPAESGQKDSGLPDSGQAESGSSDSNQVAAQMDSGQVFAQDDAGQTAAQSDSGQTSAPSDSGQTDSTPHDSAPTGDAGRQDASGGVCVTSAAKGSCGPYLYPAITGSDGSNTTVGQDVWNPISGWSQTLRATDPGSWHATANMPAGNTAVVSYPNTGENYNSNPLTSFSSMYSSFSENMNPTAGTSAEAAYDIWLNDWKNEVMIQHDMVNRGGPCGPVLATATFGGRGGVPSQKWNLCQYGSELIWQLPGKGEQTGNVDVLAMLNWLVDNGGYLPHGSTLTAIGYGFEICSTGGKDEDFLVNGFSITSR